MDFVDLIIAQWAGVRSDLDTGPMETVGRIDRLHFALRREMEKTWKLSD
ncbi:hypothetical protein [Phaeobacter sp. C3_T13_0]